MSIFGRRNDFKSRYNKNNMDRMDKKKYVSPIMREVHLFCGETMGVITQSKPLEDMDVTRVEDENFWVEQPGTNI